MSLTAPVKPPALLLSAETIARLERAKAFIDENYARNPPLPEIAAVAGLSTFHFHRVYRGHFNQTPKQRVDELRAARAKSMLLRGDRLIDVARSLGFTWQSHFGCFFKGVAGATPLRWLKAERAKHPQPTARE